jgi:hypothetical protein
MNGLDGRSSLLARRAWLWPLMRLGAVLVFVLCAASILTIFIGA